MKEKTGMGKRKIWIIVFPAVLVLILLNVGLPQRFMKAVTVGNSSYTIAAFNYYFYDTYYQFVEDHEDDLPFSLKKNLKKQDYDDTQSWQDYFHSQALQALYETARLNLAAEAAGWQPTEAQEAQISAKIKEKQQEISEYCVENNLSETDKYYTTLYDSGMTETEYFRQYENQLRAKLYKEEIEASLKNDRNSAVSTDTGSQGQTVPGADSITASKEQAVTVGCIRLNADTDRKSGKVTERQLENSRIRGENILQRWQGEKQQDETAFSELFTQWSDNADTQENNGIYTNAIKGDLPSEIEDWCFDSSRQSGDTTVIGTEKGAYVVWYEKTDGPAVSETASRKQTENQYADWLQKESQTYIGKTHAIAMIIAR